MKEVLFLLSFVMFCIRILLVAPATDGAEIAFRDLVHALAAEKKRLRLGAQGIGVAPTICKISRLAALEDTPLRFIWGSGNDERHASGQGISSC